MKAAPFLRKLTFIKYLISWNWHSVFDPEIDKDELEILKEATKFSHQGIKLVKLEGFDGNASDVQLALRLFTLAVSLEEMIFDTRMYRYDDGRRKIIPIEKSSLKFDDDIKCAQQFKRQLQSRIRVVII